MNRRALFSIVLALTVTAATAAAEQRIAFIVPTLSNPFFVDMTDAARAETALHPGVSVLIQAPERAADIEREVQMVENVITQKVDALCLVPADSKALVGVIAKANHAAIPVIIVDQDVDREVARRAGVHTSAFMGSDNRLGGRLAGEFLGAHLQGTGQVAILEGLAGSENATDRRDGFREAMQRFPGITIAASRTADWDREKGMNVAQDMLQANPALEALFAANDEMALGAIQGAKALKRKLIVIGFDAIAEANDAVRRGEMLATVAQQPALMGKLAIQTAIKVIAGEEVPPRIATEVKMVTAETLRN
jgi:ribose transport system substrate-binding protein